MGTGSSEGGTDPSGLNDILPAPFILAYDAEDPGCRRVVDWVQRRDRSGIMVSFPFQNSELVHVAPDLAGLPQPGQIYGYDTRTRRLHGGPGLIPSLFRRLPGWGWLAPLAAIPGGSRLIYRYLRR